MKFRPIIVTAMVILSASLVACQKSAKDAAKEGNVKVQEVISLSKQLSDDHKIYIISNPGTEANVIAYANLYSWNEKQAFLADIRAKLNGIISRVDDIFKTDRRKDVRINDPDGNLLRAKQNALAYLASLDSYQRTGKTGMTKMIEELQQKYSQPQDEKQLDRVQAQ